MPVGFGIYFANINSKNKTGEKMTKSFRRPLKNTVKYYLFLLSVILVFTLWVCQESFSEDAYFSHLDSVIEMYHEKEIVEKPDPSFKSYPKVACL